MIIDGGVAVEVVAEEHVYFSKTPALVSCAQQHCCLLCLDSFLFVGSQLSPFQLSFSPILHFAFQSALLLLIVLVATFEH